MRKYSTKSSELRTPENFKKINPSVDDAEEKGDDTTVVDEFFKLSHNILKEDELDLIKVDKEYLYCLTDLQLPTILSTNYNLEMLEYESDYSNEEGRVEFDETTTFRRLLFNNLLVITIECKMPVFMKIRTNDRPLLVSVYPIKRKTSGGYLGEDDGQEIDLLSLINSRKNRLTKFELVKRVKEVIQNEWDDIHRNKEPSYIYPDRAEEKFQRKYRTVKYRTKEKEEKPKSIMTRREWKRSYGVKKPDYIN
jgi:hypothetical protein